MLRASLLTVLALVAAVAAALACGAWRWRTGTRRLRRELERARRSPVPAVVDFGELADLPPPVARYFRKVMQEGQPVVVGVHLRHRGTFNLSDTGHRWRPFTSEQRVVTRRPGFDWDARIAVAPGVTVRVHDAYVAGEGRLHAALFGLIPLVDLRGAGDLATGGLMRYFAEAAWYPTALLPSQGVRWRPVDDRSADGTLTDGDLAVTLRFTFDAEGLLATVTAAARPRLVDGEVVPTPWQGRFWEYERRHGLRVPLAGEVAWGPPAGRRPYWRGRITRWVAEPAP